MSIGEKLKKRWGLSSGWDVLVVLIVFACTGFSVLYVKRWLFTLVGIDDSSALALRTAISLFVILPLYQVLLLMWGWIWGKFAFFWEFEKRMFGRIATLFKSQSEKKRR